MWSLYSYYYHRVDLFAVTITLEVDRCKPISCEKNNINRAMIEPNSSQFEKITQRLRLVYLLHLRNTNSTNF